MKTCTRSAAPVLLALVLLCSLASASPAPPPEHLAPRALFTSGRLSFTSSTSHLQDRLSQLARQWTSPLSTFGNRLRSKAASGYEGESSGEGDWLITRCPPATMARLDANEGCFCGTLSQTQSIACDGFDNANDRRTVCIEDLRQNLVNGEGAAPAAQRKKRAICGLEFISGLEPESGECPVGYTRIGGSLGTGEMSTSSRNYDDLDHFVCQDTASPFSCGVDQRDCYAEEGVLQTQCKQGSCEILMCKEGWRFKVVDLAASTEDGEETIISTTSCVPAKPLFFNSAGRI